jgi:hypothetical protein
MHCLGEDDEGGEARGGLPNEAGVGGEPGDVALVAAGEEDGPTRASPPAAAAHQVPLSEERVVIVLPDPGEAEVVQALLEVPRLVLVVAHSVGPRPRVWVGPRETGRRQRQRGDRDEEEEQEMEERMHPDVLEVAPLPASRRLSE